MKGDKGVCVVGETSEQIRRTKFDTEKNATAAMHTLIGLGVIASNFEIYKCKECGLWHFGKPEWKKQFGQ